MTNTINKKRRPCCAKNSILELRRPAEFLRAYRSAWPKILGALLCGLLLQGCETINLKRITYDFLRQEDCRRNDVAVYEFCSRTFVFEYDEYEKLRQEYIRSEQDKLSRDKHTRERYYDFYDGI